MLLQDLPNGAFLLRNSDKYYIVLTLKYDQKYINLGIEKLGNGFLRLCGEDNSSPDFVSLSQLVDYFTIHPIGFGLQFGEVGETILRKVLPHDRF